MFYYAALSEAQDVSLYLKPLENIFVDLEQTEFDELEKLLSPLLHSVCLLWANSEHYNTPGRVVVLLREICNLIISQV